MDTGQGSAHRKWHCGDCGRCLSLGVLLGVMDVWRAWQKLNPLHRKVCEEAHRLRPPAPLLPTPLRPKVSLGSIPGRKLSRVETQCTDFPGSSVCFPETPEQQENVTDLWRLVGSRPVLLFGHLVRLAGKLRCGGPRGPLVP